jgi:ankyrin repeat protein
MQQDLEQINKLFIYIRLKDLHGALTTLNKITTNLDLNRIVDSCGHTPLYSACVHKNIDIIIPLREKGADPYVNHMDMIYSPFQFCDKTQEVVGMKEVLEQLILNY